jgi:hypothetical protein
MSSPHAAPKSRQGWAYGPPRAPTSVSRQATALPSAAAEVRPIWRPTGTICSRLVYSFVFPLLRRGAKRALTQHDLPLVCPEDSSATRTASLSEAWQRERNARPHGPRFWRALLASQRWYWTLILVLSSTAKIVATQCLGLVVESVSVAPEQFEWGPASAYASGLLLAVLVGQGAHHGFYFYGWRTGMNLRTGTLGLLHEHTLRMPLASLSQVSRVSAVVSRHTGGRPFIYPLLSIHIYTSNTHLSTPLTKHPMYLTLYLAVHPPVAGQHRCGGESGVERRRKVRV